MNTTLYQIVIKQDKQAPTVYLSGEIDFAATIDLGPRLEEIVKHCSRELLFNMERVTFIDSEGIKTLLAAFRMMQNKQMNARVVSCSDQAMRVIKLVGAETLLKISNNAHTESTAIQ
ncbi:MAG: STAS domain-containing protein [Armatimonadota bacterium]|nr:STAS domain-containing protein [bacterium]